MNTIEVVKHLLLRFGASWILWLLAALSATSIVLIFERWLFYRTARADLRAMADRLHELLSARRIADAIRELSASPAIAASIAAAGLRLADHGPAAADKAMQSATALERSRLEKRLAFLGTLGNNAPFVGLFGTVIGVIAAFEELGHGAPGHGAGVSAAGQVASQAVMSSIAEALVATAVGLLVALPAVAAYNYLQRRVTSLIAETEVLSNLVLAYLVDRQLPAPEPSGAALPEAV
jgi:biopolymer transport protein ExbB